jgi:hypothetical protein
MDASVLQAAQRVMTWHLQHTVLPSPPAPPSDRAGDDDADSTADSQVESDGGSPSPAARA